jgi:F-type H+-transporting ATPase subunit delta
MAENNTIARPYAQAAFDVAREDGALADWSGSLQLAGQLFANGELAEYLANPALSEAKQLEFLTGLFAKAGAPAFAGANLKGKNFLKLLIENDRADVLPEIALHFEALKDAVENTIDVTVRSAAPLSENDRRRYIAALEKRFGRKVELSTEIDKSLIGGAVIRAGDVVIDGSLRARLQGLSNALIN